MVYTINKGKHHHNLWPIPIGIYYNKRTIEFDVTFSRNCKYIFNDADDEDVNKLIGVSYHINPHKDSVRFGWNYNKTTDKISLYYYCYVDNKRTFGIITEVPFEERKRGKISIFNDGYLLEANGDHVFIESDCKKKRLSFLLHPYFGGNKTAPHKMNIKIKRIS